MRFLRLQNHSQLIMKTWLALLLATYFLVMRTVLADGLFLADGLNARGLPGPRGLSINGGLFSFGKRCNEGDLSSKADHFEDPPEASITDINENHVNADDHLDKRNNARMGKRQTGMMSFRRSTKAAWYLGKRGSDLAVTPPTVNQKQTGKASSARRYDPYLQSARWLGLVPSLYRRYPSVWARFSTK